MSEQKKGFPRNIQTPPVELRSCIRCGKPAELLKFNFPPPDAYSVWCSDFDCSYKDKSYDTPEEACAVWNSLDDGVLNGNSKFSRQTPPVKLHPCHVCGRQPVLLAENDDVSFQYRCQCAEELSVGSGPFSTAERAAAEWNRINEPFGSPLLHTVSGYLSLLNPCPFCECKPELHKCPNPADEGWFVRCRCASGDKLAETVCHLTVRDAVDAWNTRASKRPPFFQPHRHIPSGLFLAGSFLCSYGFGLNGGPAFFLIFFGLSLTVFSFLLPFDSLCSENFSQPSSSGPLLRPDLPDCSFCGEVPVLHKTASGRFRVQCSDPSCWGSARKRFVYLTEKEAAAAWTAAQKS